MVKVEHQENPMFPSFQEILIIQICKALKYVLMIRSDLSWIYNYKEMKLFQRTKFQAKIESNGNYSKIIVKKIIFTRKNYN